MVKQFLSTFDKVSSFVLGNSWYFDFACCNHMSHNPQLFSSIIPTTSLIQTDNGSHISISHIGFVSTPLLSLSLTPILFPTSLLISSLLVNYVNLVLTCGLDLLVVVCRILIWIWFLGQTLEWDEYLSLHHSTYLPHRHPFYHMLLMLFMFFLCIFGIYV